MKKISLLFFTICLSLIASAQITIIGHNTINFTPLANVSIVVKEAGVITKTLNTLSKPEFKLQLDFGKIYQIYVQHPKSPVMYFEVLANTVPLEKYEFRMGHEFNLPFFYKTDEDVDTAVFKNPFYRIVFNGNRKMVDDTAYNTAFSKKIIKESAVTKGETQYAAIEIPETKTLAPVAKEIKDTIKPTATKTLDGPVIVAGKVYLNGNKQLPIKNKPIALLNKEGKVIKSTYTNRFGAFSFTGVKASEVAAVRMEIKDITVENTLNLMNSKNAAVLDSKPLNNLCDWNLSSDNLEKLVDNNFTTNIGGKLISSSPKEKKFYAGQEVFLINKHNTIIKKTNTNLFGTFVFENIKPDNSYFIAISKAKNIPGERVDLLSKEDNFIGSLDSLVAGKQAMKITSSYNKVFNELSIGEDEMKMDVKATIYGDNVNTPIGKLKIVLLNDNYQVIDSTVTDDFGSFKFKYLPFLKRFYLSAENTDNILDVFKNIIIYSNEANLIKIMTHQKGSRFSYKPVDAEASSIRDLELEDPWLELIDTKTTSQKRNITDPKKTIVENILFETGKYEITTQSKEILDKVILVLNTNKKLILEIGAHTDSKGNELSNLKLSQLRAKTVQDYISRAGIDVKRLISKGYGETKLINKCKDNEPCSEIEHAQNRRIEFKILGE